MANPSRIWAVGVLAVSFAPWLGLSSAQARMPLSIDLPEPTVETAQPSPHAQAAPAAFAAPQADSLEPVPTLEQSGPRLQCVPFARQLSGVQIWGNANTWWQQSRGRFEQTRAPEIGAVMTMRGYRSDARGHVAVVQEVLSDRLVLIDHANWLNRGEITRGVPVRDVSAAGDWSEVQVWHVPGGHWGGRVYRVRGFILPPARAVQAQTAPAPETAAPAERPGPQAQNLS